MAKTDSLLTLQLVALIGCILGLWFYLDIVFADIFPGKVSISNCEMYVIPHCYVACLRSSPLVCGFAQRDSFILFAFVLNFNL